MTATGMKRPGCITPAGRSGRLAALAAAALACAVAAFSPAIAADCPGNADALGTSRTIVVDPTEHPRIGTMQYAETLPLRDHEVVLTFDDGPLPRHSLDVLNILDAQCVKSTFFIVGRMAKQFPQELRRIHESGHTIGTHSENHPLTFHRMPVEKAVQEIDEGIAHTAAALGDAGLVAPFFRIPGLLRAGAVETYLAARGIMTWSADFPADDWRHISSAQVAHLAISRLEAKGKGVLLLHDIQPRTVAALPTILRELKLRGYRIVHVVPARPGLPKTPTEPADWRMHPDTPVAIRWPVIPDFVFSATDTMPAPALVETVALMSVATLATIPQRRARAGRTIPLPLISPWPRVGTTAAVTAIDLPVADGSLFRTADPASARLQADARPKSLSRVPQAVAAGSAARVSEAQRAPAGGHPVPSATLTP